MEAKSVISPCELKLVNTTENTFIATITASSGADTYTTDLIISNVILSFIISLCSISVTVNLKCSATDDSNGCASFNDKLTIQKGFDYSVELDEPITTLKNETTVA